jgi:hypothetical protein
VITVKVADLDLIRVGDPTLAAIFLLWQHGRRGTALNLEKMKFFPNFSRKSSCFFAFENKTFHGQLMSGEELLLT